MLSTGKLKMHLSKPPRVRVGYSVFYFAIIMTSIFMFTSNGWSVIPCSGSIGDFVWNDMNRNGIQDAVEPGIDGVTVNLKDDQGTVIATTTTFSNGFYEFSGLCTGEYTVEVDETTLLLNFVPTPSNQGADPTIDSNGSPAAVNLPDNTNDPTIDFGYYSPCSGTIGDFVWNDLNRDGLQDVGEPGIEGVTVNLKDYQGTMIATTTTGSNGFYEFSGLCAEDYTVDVDGTTLPPNFVPSPCNQGADDAIDNDCSPVDVTLLDDNTKDPTIDFGYYQMELVGTGTPGYWKNHRNAWPVEEITIGGAPYSKKEAIDWMKHKDGDKTITLFRSLVSAKLNVMIGADGSCVAETIAAADAWMAMYPVGSGVDASSEAWYVGEPLYIVLDDYNNGYLFCAPSRDDLE